MDTTLFACVRDFVVGKACCVYATNFCSPTKNTTKTNTQSVQRFIIKETRMAKKRESKKKRAASEDSSGSNDGKKALSKFTEFEIPVVAPPAAEERVEPKAPLAAPEDFVPTLSAIVTSDGVAVSLEPAAQPQAAQSTAPEDLVPIHLIQTMSAQSVAVTPGSTSASMLAPGGLLKEPGAPKNPVRVTIDGMPPPPMRLELVSLLA